MDNAKIDNIAQAVIDKRVMSSVRNRVIEYGGGTEADVKKVLKAIGKKLG